ncbi:MAG: hypothetical protein ABSC08_17035 [Bryobacteraceae bacterium]|jgi:hypothetical protein
MDELTRRVREVVRSCLALGRGRRTHLEYASLEEVKRWLVAVDAAVLDLMRFKLDLIDQEQALEYVRDNHPPTIQQEPKARPRPATRPARR